MKLVVRSVLIWMAAAMLAWGVTARAEEARDQKPARFKPPSRGAPDSRIGGGVRGSGEVMLVALVPRQIALTVSPQPTMYWYLDRAAEAPLQLAVTRLDNYETVYEASVPRNAAAGIAAHRMAGEVKLEPKIQYEWTLTLVTSEDNPSLNPVTGGWLTLVEESDELKAAVKGKSAAAQVGAYAERGIWYEALHALESAIVAAPEDAELRELRRSLLSDENVGLEEVVGALEELEGE